MTSIGRVGLKVVYTDVDGLVTNSKELGLETKLMFLDCRDKTYQGR